MIRRAGSRVNLTFPMWELGACLYWRSFDPMHVQTPGGLGAVDYSYVDGGGTLFPYYVYDTGKGHFRQVDPSAAPEFPPDGYLPGGRSSNFNNSQDTERGFTVFEAGLTKTNPAINARHILDPATSGLADQMQVANASGGPLKFRRLDTTSATNTNCFQVLLKRTDGGVIDGTVAELWTAAATGDPNAGSATTYRKIREDGWYALDMTQPPVVGAPNYYYGVVLQDGFTVLAEMPCIEGVSTTQFIASHTGPHLGSNPSRYVHALTIRRKDEAVVPGLEGWHEDGWIACLLVDPYPSTLTRAFGVGLNHEEGAFGNTDYECLSMSSSNQNFVSQMYVGGVSQYYFDRTAALAAGRVSALVTSWGRREGTRRAYMFENGRMVELDVSYDLPAAADPTVYQIGFRNVNSSAFAHKIQAVVIGRNYLTRNECRLFSNWLRKQAFSTIS